MIEAHHLDARSVKVSGQSSVGEQLVEKALACVEEASSEANELGIVVGDFLQPAVAARVDRRVGIREDDRRVGGDDELRLLGRGG